VDRIASADGRVSSSFVRGKSDSRPTFSRRFWANGQPRCHWRHLEGQSRYERIFNRDISGSYTALIAEKQKQVQKPPHNWDHDRSSGRSTTSGHPWKVRRPICWQRCRRRRGNDPPLASQIALLVNGSTTHRPFLQGVKDLLRLMSCRASARYPVQPSTP
jgi:hypothetical protein